MAALNNACIAGYLEQAPVLRGAEPQSRAAHFLLLIPTLDRDGRPAEPDWIETQVIGRQAEAAAQQLQPGTYVILQGALRSERAADPATGEIRRWMELRAFQFDAPGLPAAPAAARQAPATSPAQPATRPAPAHPAGPGRGAPPPVRRAAAAAPAWNAGPLQPDPDEEVPF